MAPPSCPPTVPSYGRQHPTRAGLLCLASVLLVSCSPEVLAPARPHVLLVSIDTLRADHLSSAGYPFATTPVMDQVAAEGVRFERCISSTSWTLPAHITMFTGLPISAHGIDDDRLWRRLDGQGQPIAPDLRGRFLAESLQAAGYDTAGWFTWKYLDARFGFGRGFNRWERLGHNFYSHPEVGPAWMAARDADDADGMRALYAQHPELFGVIHSTSQVVDQAIGWLENRGEQEQPFFLFLHLFDVHNPYVSPEPFHSQFDPTYEGDIDGTRVTAPVSPVHADMDPRDLQNLVARYDGGIRHVDDQLGRLLESLKHLGLDQDTLLVVTSDHGEEFFEHGGKTHRGSVHLESIQVPLILRWPAGIEEPRVVSGTVGIVDLAPTILAATGSDHAAPMGGRNLLPMARGAAADPRADLSELIIFEEGRRVPLRRSSWIRGNEQVTMDMRGPTIENMVRFDLSVAGGGFGPGVALPEGSAGREQFQKDLAHMREGLLRLRQGSPRMENDLAPLTPFELQDLSSMGYGGGDNNFHTERMDDRLSLDGGVWPDQE